MRAKLTPYQKDVLRLVIEGKNKMDCKPGRSHLWRCFDQLERRGLVAYQPGGKYLLTDAGREAVAAHSI